MKKEKIDQGQDLVNNMADLVEKGENFVKNSAQNFDKMSSKEKGLFFKQLDELDKELENMERELEEWDREYIKDSCFEEDQILPIFLKGI